MCPWSFGSLGPSILAHFSDNQCVGCVHPSRSELTGCRCTGCFLRKGGSIETTPEDVRENGDEQRNTRLRQREGDTGGMGGALAPLSQIISFFCPLHFLFPSMTLQKLNGGPSMMAPHQPYSYIETCRCNRQTPAEGGLTHLSEPHPHLIHLSEPDTPE